jgi:sedoheptulokinase
VVNALGDNQASFLGSVGQPDQDLLVNIGTGGQISATTTQVVPPGTLETRPFLDEQELLVGAGVTGGNAYAVLNDFIRQVGEQVFNVAIDKDALYGILHQLAEAVPAGSDGLQCEPFFAGTRRQPERRGSFSEVSRRAFTPGHLARSLLEGMADTFLTLYSEMQANGLRPRTRLIGSGNCLRRNPLLAASLSDRFGLPLVTPRHTEEAAFGAALLASVAVGEQSLASAGRLIQYESMS